MNPSGSIVLDVDQDGRLDFISGQTSVRNAHIVRRIYAFHNQTPFGKKKSLTFKLRGKRATAHGEGARVVLKTNRQVYRRINSFSYGHLNSQNEEGVSFALQKGEVPRWVEVHWPFLLRSRSRDKQKTLSSRPLVIKYFLTSLKLGRSSRFYLCDDGRLSSHGCF